MGSRPGFDTVVMKSQHSYRKSKSGHLVCSWSPTGSSVKVRGSSQDNNKVELKKIL